MPKPPRPSASEVLRHNLLILVGLPSPTLDLSYGQGAMTYAHSLAVFSFVQCEMSAGCFSSTRSHCLVHERPGYRLGMGRWAGL